MQTTTPLLFLPSLNDNSNNINNINNNNNVDISQSKLNPNSKAFYYNYDQEKNKFFNLVKLCITELLNSETFQIIIGY